MKACYPRLEVVLHSGGSNKTGSFYRTPSFRRPRGSVKLGGGNLAGHHCWRWREEGGGRHRKQTGGLAGEKEAKMVLWLLLVTVLPLINNHSGAM